MQALSLKTSRWAPPLPAVPSALLLALLFMADPGGGVTCGLSLVTWCVGPHCLCAWSARQIEDLVCSERNPLKATLQSESESSEPCRRLSRAACTWAMGVRPVLALSFLYLCVFPRSPPLARKNPLRSFPFSPSSDVTSSIILCRDNCSCG